MGFSIGKDGTYMYLMAANGNEALRGGGRRA